MDVLYTVIVDCLGLSHQTLVTVVHPREETSVMITKVFNRLNTRGHINHKLLQSVQQSENYFPIIEIAKLMFGKVL